MDPKEDQPLKTTNDGQMNEVVTEETDRQNGESQQPPDSQPVAEPCVKQETSGCMPALPRSQEGLAPVPRRPARGQDAALHETHSFKWQWNNKCYTITCSKARSVQSVLKGSAEFNKIAKKNVNKELLILRNGKAISTHFPCSLVKNELLTLKYLKAAAAPKQPHDGFDHRQKKRPSSELVTFHLLTKGGAGVKRIMRNPELEKKNINEITVYAYKGEKVKYALKKDGRLLDTVFKKNCALSNTSTNVTSEMSDLVHDHDGETFRIKLLDMSDPPESLPGSLEETYPVQIESPDSENNPPLQSVNINTPENTAGSDGKKAQDVFCKIRHSKKLQIDLTKELKKMLNGMNNQRVPSSSCVRTLFRVEYSKNNETCREVRTMKTLMDLSDSVCQVRINDRVVGSGFLLFDKFVLTNGHVAESFYNKNTQHLSLGVTVHFSFESLGQHDPGAVVEEVVGFENRCDESEQKHDWALMRIRTDQKLPGGLLTRFGFMHPKCRGINIIGHPRGNVKMIDPCFIIPKENRQHVVERHKRDNPVVCPHNPHYQNGGNIQLITSCFFEDVKDDKEFSQALHYNSCFAFGSSGSPVFDEDCNVVAMHTGGYAYHDASGELHSVIEYGCPLSAIIGRILAQMVKKRKNDVWQTLLACCPEQHQPDMKAYLEQLVENNRNELFSHAHLPVPMEY